MDIHYTEWKKIEIKRSRLETLLIALLAAMGSVSLLMGLILASELIRLAYELDVDVSSLQLLFVVGVFLPISLGLTQIITAYLMSLMRRKAS